MPKVSKADRDEAIQNLRDLLKPGATVYTILRDVSRSGMSRNIDVQYLGDGEPRWLSSLVAKATGFTFNPKRECLRVGGCGMDMGFHVVSTLSRVLYPAGFGCIGNPETYLTSEGRPVLPGVHCPSNDHSNGDRDYRPHVDDCPQNSAEVGTDIPRKRAYSHWHRAGDYAIRQRWL